MRAISKLRSSRGRPTVCTIVSILSDESAARVRPPVMTKGRTKSCVVASGGSSSFMLAHSRRAAPGRSGPARCSAGYPPPYACSLKDAFLQLCDERRTERRAHPFDEQCHLVANGADVATTVGDNSEGAAIR